MKKHGLKIYPAEDKLVSADNSDLHCVGVCYIHINGFASRTLVADSIGEDLLIGWPDLIQLGVISPNFPEVCRVASASPTAHQKIIDNLQSQYKDLSLIHI